MEPASILKEGAEHQFDISYNLIQKIPQCIGFEKGYPIHTICKSSSQIKIKEEYKYLCMTTDTNDHQERMANLPSNLNYLNRYMDIKPYTHTQVILPGSSLEEQYVNANYINSSFSKSDKKFIATQGPPLQTGKNFWSMVWNESIQLIVMLCKLQEGNRIKCDQYWPPQPNKIMKFPGFSIKNVSENKTNADLFITQLQLTNEKNSQSKTITHLQYLAWPDHGIPKVSNIQSIEKMLNLIESHEKENPQQKIIFHCSAGVGRTGTIIALYNLICLAKAVLKHNPNPHLSVFSEVRRLREQRISMVQTFEQYKFIYDYLGSFLPKLLK